MSKTAFSRLETTPSQRDLFLITGISGILSIVIFLLMRPVETALKQASAFGVIELEFAWTVEQINVIFDAWGPELINQELLITFIDYGFLIAYSFFLASLSLLITRKVKNQKIQLVGYYMVIASFSAATFDAIENFNLILMLSSPKDFPNFSPVLASICATLKFGLIILIILYWIVSGFFELYTKMTRK
jgi:hypothetical protein